MSNSTEPGKKQVDFPYELMHLIIGHLKSNVHRTWDAAELFAVSTVDSRWRYTALGTHEAWAGVVLDPDGMDTEKFTTILERSGCLPLRIQTDIQLQPPNVLHNGQWRFLLSESGFKRLESLELETAPNALESLDFGPLKAALANPNQTLKRFLLRRSPQEHYRAVAPCAIFNQSSEFTALDDLILENFIIDRMTSPSIFRNVRRFIYVHTYGLDPLLDTFWVQAAEAMVNLEEIKLCVWSYELRGGGSMNSPIVRSHPATAAADLAVPYRPKIASPKLKTIVLHGNLPGIANAYSFFNAPDDARRTFHVNMDQDLFMDVAHEPANDEMFTVLWNRNIPVDCVSVHITNGQIQFAAGKNKQALAVVVFHYTPFRNERAGHPWLSYTLHLLVCLVGGMSQSEKDLIRDIPRIEFDLLCDLPAFTTATNPIGSLFALFPGTKQVALHPPSRKDHVVRIIQEYAPELVSKVVDATESSLEP
ncbi:hypothetical protein FA15DRAFT_701482 [Coprinopsis marcescibilis]|uniref:Uncharacterized protein n=1 Tax=Coprinopsis marcescibilis TaxID=230819 RepID=A0A5C3L4C5_COPMA|nr:hypothetical protein FA15DRAFT_701482 [Coprinopsis marcescibilis]